MTTKPIRVLLADDHALVRQGFRRILEDEPDIVVAGEASGGARAIELARSLLPDVIVMDLAMPRSTDCTRRSRSSGIDPGVAC